MKKFSIILLLIFSTIGALDSGYLTIEHFQHAIVPCSSGVFADCGKVLSSQYSTVLGVPLALIGFIHYLALTMTIIYVLRRQSRIGMFIILGMSTVGVISSLYFVYLQLFVIHAICQFCMLSALTSLLLFITAHRTFIKERKLFTSYVVGYVYEHLLKPLFFQINPETIHNMMVHHGERMGKIGVVKKILSFFFQYENKALAQNIYGINFNTPIGLAAGFDYEARLTQILPSLSFGFHTVGTITKGAYAGNPRPLLGRLPKSQSLMVNKGFKNLGAKATWEKLHPLSFQIPLGVSIGRTNGKKIMTQEQSVQDIVAAFRIFEKPGNTHSYYELNISCPNLYGTATFYPPKNLDRLLSAVEALRITRPIFIKMPIEKSKKEVLSMLRVIDKHTPVGVIFGNLQKNRKHPSLDPSEVSQFNTGYFSGKPTFDQSNELISLTYRHYKNRFIIIGCGGVFSAHDAYEKIKRGATIVQLITGMIFKGPQLVSQINIELLDLLKKDGFTHISQAVGTKR